MPLSHRELERLYDAHASGLFHYLATLTKNEADARDLLQEVFIRLARLENTTSLENEKPFVFRLAHNLAIDWLRRRKTRWDSEERLLAGHFAAAMRSLPDEQRTIAQLQLWDGLTFEEIAHTQNIPLNTAASRYRYAIDKLRTLLRPIYEELT